VIETVEDEFLLRTSSPVLIGLSPQAKKRGSRDDFNTGVRPLQNSRACTPNVSCIERKDESSTNRKVNEHKPK
jgi:hypothetical protein